MSIVRGMIQNNRMKKLRVSIVCVIAFVILLVVFLLTTQGKQTWEVRSIDTMKYSRDMARDRLHDPNFNKTIDKQMAAIKATGANYVAIDTPYDEEFRPFLRRWVTAARTYGLHVWFRGNWSGWEGWFGYPKIDEQTHIAQTRKFILQNQDLFRDGDIFTSCPECENGMHPQIGNAADMQQYKSFLLQEYGVTNEAFHSIGKNVQANYYSMNETIAAAIMDKQTTQQFGGVVVIDHYVATPEQMASDVKKLAAQSGGKIVIGEFGVPIPDLQGQMTDKQQSDWISKALTKLSQIPEVSGVNYWVNVGGSTALWHANGSAKPAVGVITDYYKRNRSNFFGLIR